MWKEEAASQPFFNRWSTDDGADGGMLLGHACDVHAPPPEFEVSRHRPYQPVAGVCRQVL